MGMRKRALQLSAVATIAVGMAMGPASAVGPATPTRQWRIPRNTRLSSGRFSVAGDRRGVSRIVQSIQFRWGENRETERQSRCGARSFRSAFAVLFQVVHDRGAAQGELVGEIVDSGSEDTTREQQIDLVAA